MPACTLNTNELNGESTGRGWPATSTIAPGEGATVVRRLEDLFRATAREVLDDAGVGAVIFVDELQAADRDGIQALAYAWQHLQAEPEGVPIALVCAGLGHTEDVVTDAASFAERFAYRQLGSLDEAATREAITAPATALGVSWETAAVTEIVRRTQGYP